MKAKDTILLNDVSRAVYMSAPSTKYRAVHDRVLRMLGTRPKERPGRAAMRTVHNTAKPTWLCEGFGRQGPLERSAVLIHDQEDEQRSAVL